MTNTAPEKLMFTSTVKALKPAKKVAPKQPVTTKQVIKRVLLYGLMAILALPFVFPVYWMFVTAIKPIGTIFENPPKFWPDVAEWENFLVPFTSGPFLGQFFNSFYIAALSTLGILVFASLAGYAFARIQFPGRNLFFLLLLSAMLIPAEVTIIPLYRIIDSFGWVDSHLALLIPTIFGAPSVLSIFLMRQFFLSMPVELEQAARIDGLSRFGIFWRVALPLAKAPLGALAILAFLGSWNDFLEPLVFLRSRDLWTLPLALQSFIDPATGVPIWNVQSAAMVWSVVPVLIVFFFAQKQFIQGIAGTGIK